MQKILNVNLLGRQVDGFLQSLGKTGFFLQLWKVGRDITNTKTGIMFWVWKSKDPFFRRNAALGNRTF